MTRSSVLLIEDDEDIVELLRYNLEQETFRVWSAASGEAGLELLQSHPRKRAVKGRTLSGHPGRPGRHWRGLLSGSSRRQTGHTPRRFARSPRLEFRLRTKALQYRVRDRNGVKPNVSDTGGGCPPRNIIDPPQASRNAPISADT